MEIFLTSEAWIALLTLSLLEIVLGIDNIIFISLLTNKLPEERRKTDQLLIMILAVVISLIVMLIFAGKIASFIERYPTLQILALAFLILIGFVLIADGLHQHISKGYIYFAVAFSLAIEVVNIRVRKKSKTD